MPRIEIPIVGGAYQERSTDLNAQTCVNLYPVPGGPGGRAAGALYGTPGLKQFSYFGVNPIRGMAAGTPIGDRVLVVAGNQVGRVETNGTYFQVGVGPLASSSGRVAIAHNGQVTLIVDGVNNGAASGYLVTSGMALNPISDADMPLATQAAFLGGYFVFDDPATPGKFMVSALYATSTSAFVNALDYATAEADPDGLVAIRAVGDRLWLLGVRTTEIWYQSGESFPFTRAGRLGRGCSAKWSPAVLADSVVWLSDDPAGMRQVVQASGSGEVRVLSTPPIEDAIRGYSAIADAEGYVYHQGGHTFYVLTFPTAGVTWVYDFATELWHRRGGWSAPNWTRHPGVDHVFFAGKNLVSDPTAGKLFELDPATYTDDGATIRRERAVPVVHADGKRMFFNVLDLHAETGVGLGVTPYNAWAASTAYAIGAIVRDTASALSVAFVCTAAGTSGSAQPAWNTTIGGSTTDGTVTWQAFTPTQQVMLDWSDDGGHTWSADRLGDVGAPGAYAKRIRFHRLGSSRSRIFRVVISDPVKVALISATIDAEVGA